jgi:16S rRNA (cytosine967-C5)-methyltransferase
VPREDGSAVRSRSPVFPDPARDLAGNLAARYSAPAWLVARWLEARGPARTRALLQAALQRPPLTLRARGNRDALLRRLVEAGAEAAPGMGRTALTVSGAGEAAAIAAVGRGEAWVQDATSQRAAPLLDPRPGERLLDLCAAPGGKTLHLADLLGNGTVVACDVEEEKLADVEKVRPHLPPGVVLETRLLPREGPLPFEAASFDGVLVDAPCTNTGVLRRRVEARWRLSPADVGALAAVQADLLDRAWPLVRPGGRLVYATCSMEPEENSGVVEPFLARHPDARLAEATEIPSTRDGDGGFAALIEKRLTARS